MRDELMASGTAGSWSGANIGGADRLNDGVQQITQCYQIWDGSYNSRFNDRLWSYSTDSKQRSRLGANMCECQYCQRPSHAHIEQPIAQSFWNIVGICYGRLRGLLGLTYHS